MALFRLELALLSPLGTPLTSGTLFGHLCWVVREGEGEAALEAWLRELPESPWAVSDGFPRGYLPRPLLTPSAPLGKRPTRLTKEALDRLERAKGQRKLPFIARQRWDDLRVGMNAARVDAAACRASRAEGHRIAHNTIDRGSGTTPEAGGLWFVDEWWADEAAAAIDVYVRADAPVQQIRALFSRVGEAGYGRDASTGRGLFRVRAVTVEDELDASPRAGGTLRLLSLSEGSVSANMQDCCYKITTHYGKIGRAMVVGGARPWKLPLLLTRAGATFVPKDAGPFGAWLTGVHQDRPEIGHNAFHCAIPFTYREGA